MKKKITLATLAEAAQVSKTTVSRALRNHPTLPQTTCKRIQEIAQKLNYAPDPFATSLGLKKTGSPINANIACLIGHRKRDFLKTSPAYQRIYKGAKERATQLGYHIEHFWIYGPKYRDSQLDKILLSRGVSGIILLGILDENEVSLDWDRYAVVASGNHLLNDMVHLTAIDSIRCARLALKKLLDMPFKKIGLVTSNLNRYGDDQRCIDFLCAFSGLQNLNSEYKERICSPLVYSSIQQTESRIEFNQWLQKEKPDVIVTRNHDHRTSHAELSWLQAAGFNVPDDISLVELNVLDSNGPITGVIEPYHETGAASVDMLSTLIHHNTLGIPKNRVHSYLEPSWHPGNSIKEF